MLKIRNYLMASLLIPVVATFLLSPTLAYAHLEPPTEEVADTVVSPNVDNSSSVIVEASQPKKPWLSHQTVHYLQLLLIVGGTVAVIWRSRQIEALRRQGLLK